MRHRFLIPVWLICHAVSAQIPDLLTADPPTDVPGLFAPGFISGPYMERDMAISRRLDELFFTVQGPAGDLSVILFTQKRNGRWTAPEVAPFSGRYRDIEPFLTPDGSRLYFSSNRPKTAGAGARDFDIWYVDRQNGIWQEPVRLDGPVNTDRDEYYPSLATSGNLYFTAAYEGGTGQEDLYVSRPENGRYGKPQILPETVNSKGYEFNAFVDPAERFLIYTAYGRPEGLGRGDLYISFRDPDGRWQPARLLPEPLNSSQIDYCPYVSPDGKWFFFASKRSAPAPPQRWTAETLHRRLNGVQNGLEDIYWVSAEVLWKLK
ncbi:TolB family protein [Larkinella soli]|uniref:TolB family protein n=1 Tax=Larkinella soli TaxID=1770527 RepID=UPI000FFC620A|nr:PD40 domain-containing protein [Larkinella soli]